MLNPVVLQKLDEALKVHIRSRKALGGGSKDLLINYKALCKDAGLPNYTRVCGRYLGELAAMYEAQGLPPLNAVVVNKTTGNPGAGYPGKKWLADLIQVHITRI